MEAFSSRRRGDETPTEKKLETPHVVSYKDEFVERLKRSDAKLGAANYESGGEKFFRPTSFGELFRLLKANPDARLIAGATELGLEITKRYKKFSTLISTEAVAELTEIKSIASEWHIGGAVTLTVIKDKLGGERSEERRVGKEC